MTKSRTCPFHAGRHPGHRRWVGYQKSSTCVGCCLARRNAGLPGRYGARDYHALVDDLAVAAAIAGHRGMLTTRAEKVEAVRTMTKWGLSARQIATALGMHPDSVSRYRTREGKA